jgi:hypothetical protein
MSTGRVSLTPNIAGLEDFDVLGFLRGRFGPDVAIENDVNLAMLGEHALGCASGCRNAAFLSLGTGAGLGLLIDDKLFRGACGSAGEIVLPPRPNEIKRRPMRIPGKCRARLALRLPEGIAPVCPGFDLRIKRHEERFGSRGVHFP